MIFGDVKIVLIETLNYAAKLANYTAIMRRKKVFFFHHFEQFPILTKNYAIMRLHNFHIPNNLD